jgi:hypothetical protein
MTRQHRLVLAGVTLMAIVLAVGGLWFAGDGKPPSGDAPKWDAAQLRTAQAKVDAAWSELGREGIYVTGIGMGDPTCVSVELLNPSPDNIQTLERRFGPGICVSRRPSGLSFACTGYVPVGDLPTGPVVVPDVGGLDLLTAEQRLRALGLRWSTACAGRADDRVPPADSPLRHARITGQCPLAGEPVPRDTLVVLDGVLELPGGYRTRMNAPSACRDGRQAVGG